MVGGFTKSKEAASVSDEQPTEPLTGDVRVAPVVRQNHGGAIRRGSVKQEQRDPTPAMARAKSLKAWYGVIPRVTRIARNQSKKGKKPRFTTMEQLRAAEALARYGNDDRISAADLREACRGMASDIRDFLPADQAEALIAIVARRFVYL